MSSEASDEALLALFVLFEVFVCVRSRAMMCRDVGRTRTFRVQRLNSLVVVVSCMIFHIQQRVTQLACVASVSVGFPCTFRCFDKLRRKQKKKEGGGAEEKKYKNIFSNKNVT